MTTLKLRTFIRRLGRLALLILLGYPYVIVLLPVLVWFGAHLISGWFNLEKGHGWTWTELAHCMGLTLGVVMLTALVLVYLAATIYVGWKGHGLMYRRGSWASIGRPWMHAVVSHENLLKRIEALGATHRLVGPVRHGAPRCVPPRRHFYESVKSANALALDFDYCVYSPKAALLPSRETLFRFDTENRRFEAVVENGNGAATAIIGVHPCDLHAIRLLDETFARDHRDEHYWKRRDRLLIVGIDCGEPCTAGVFCRETNTNGATDGFDVMLYPLAADGEAGVDGRSVDAFGVVYGTEAGYDWLAGDDGLAAQPPTVDDQRRFERYLIRKKSAFPRRLAQSWSDIPETLTGSYDSLVWEATAQRCYSCGSCNLVCPTCYCFDIQDCNDLPVHRGHRERTWDGCMLRDFAVVAGGHNFRSQRAQRLRHRIFRKCAWIERRSGLAGCVGCGRCDRACTAHISIVEVLNQLAEERDGGERHARVLSAQAAGV